MITCFNVLLKFLIDTYYNQTNYNTNNQYSSSTPTSSDSSVSPISSSYTNNASYPTTVSNSNDIASTYSSYIPTPYNCHEAWQARYMQNISGLS